MSPISNSFACDEYCWHTKMCPGLLITEPAWPTSRQEVFRQRSRITAAQQAKCCTGYSARKRTAATSSGDDILDNASDAPIKVTSQEEANCVMEYAGRAGWGVEKKLPSSAFIGGERTSIAQNLQFCCVLDSPHQILTVWTPLEIVAISFGDQFLSA